MTEQLQFRILKNLLLLSPQFHHLLFMIVNILKVFLSLIVRSKFHMLRNFLNYLIYGLLTVIIVNLLSLVSFLVIFKLEVTDSLSGPEHLAIVISFTAHYVGGIVQLFAIRLTKYLVKLLLFICLLLWES